MLPDAIVEPANWWEQNNFKDFKDLQPPEAAVSNDIPGLYDGIKHYVRNSGVTRASNGTR